VIPASAAKLWTQLGFSEPLESQSLEAQAWGQLPCGQRIGTAEVIFPRLDKDAALAGISATAASEDKSPQKRTLPTMPIESDPVITIDDFAKVDLRVGEILTAERIPGATKLLKLTVDLGQEVRQVLAGIAEYYRPEDLVGMKVIVVANLKPRKMRGLESQGMVVAASVGDEGRPVLATFKQEVPNGTKLR
jgi:methionyl-tRNA synthetase